MSYESVKRSIINKVYLEINNFNNGPLSIETDEGKRLLKSNVINIIWPHYVANYLSSFRISFQTFDKCDVDGIVQPGECEYYMLVELQKCFSCNYESHKFFIPHESVYDAFDRAMKIL